MTQRDLIDHDSTLKDQKLQQILLIDDSKSVHTLVCAILGGEPVSVHSAYDAEAGIAMAASFRPDLIMLDVEMPGIDGFAACRRLKADPATKGIPIIFLTGRVTTEEMALGLNLGANDYMAKPFNGMELLSRIRDFTADRPFNSAA